MHGQTLAKDITRRFRVERKQSSHPPKIRLISEIDGENTTSLDHVLHTSKELKSR